MPPKSPRFWIEILILGFVLVAGMIVLNEYFPSGQGSILRIAFAAIVFTVYGRHYERYWNRKQRN